MKGRIFGHTMPAIEMLIYGVSICLIIIVLFIIIFIFWVNKEQADLTLTKFLNLIFKKLPNKDLNSLIINNKLLCHYNHTYRSIWCIMKEIIRYGENNFSEESLNILKEEIFQEMLKEIEKEDYHSKALSIKEALKKRPYEIFRHYVFYSLDEKIYEKDKKYYLSRGCKFFCVYR